MKDTAIIRVRVQMAANCQWGRVFGTQVIWGRVDAAEKEEGQIGRRIMSVDGELREKSIVRRSEIRLELSSGVYN